MKTYRIRPGSGVTVYPEICRKNETEPPHTHEFIELVYIQSGSGIHTVNTTTYQVSRGDLLFIDYGEIHTFFSEGGMEYYNILIASEFMVQSIGVQCTIADIFRLFVPQNVEELKKSPLVHFSGNDRAETEELLRHMAEECLTHRPFCHLLLNAYMRVLFSKMIRAVLDANNVDRRTLLSERIKEYIDRNYTEPLTVATLSDLCFYNTAYVGRTFHKRYGITMKKYIRDKRMQYARELLREGELSVEEIAYRVGYSSRTRFYRCFREIFGISPGEMRKRYRVP